jgi:hypothetical protein
MQLLMPTAISLIGIGGLTLVTPLVTTLSRGELIVDLVVGGTMILCGIICGLLGRRAH